MHPLTRALTVFALCPALFTLGFGLAGSDPALAARCKDYTNCGQAVENWCQGRHSRADGDSDGIPCENVCKTKEQADRHRNGRRCPG